MAAMAQVPWAPALDHCLDFCDSTATASVQASQRWDERGVFWRRMWQRALERDQVQEHGLSGVLATEVILALATLPHDHAIEAMPMPAPTAAAMPEGELTAAPMGGGELDVLVNDEIMWTSLRCIESSAAALKRKHHRTARRHRRRCPSTIATSDCCGRCQFTATATAAATGTATAADTGHHHHRCMQQVISRPRTTCEGI